MEIDGQPHPEGATVVGLAKAAVLATVEYLLQIAVIDQTGT